MSLSKISDTDLMICFQDIVIEECEKLSLQLEYIAELDRRKLFYHYSSLRSFLVEEYGMEEWNAERKIRAARLLKRFPEIKDRLQSGKLNLTLLELAMGCAHRERLSDPELSEIFTVISGMSSRAAMREIASRYPQTSELPKDRIRPLTADYSEVRFVASHELLEKLDEIRGLLSHAYPEGLKMGELIEVLATEYRERHHPEEKAKRAKARKEKQTEKNELPTAQRVLCEDSTSTPTQIQSENERTQNNPNRTINIETRIANRALQHLLINKDGYQCSFVDDVTKKRCLSQNSLEIDHIHPWSKGGRTELSNLRFLCTQHHARVSFLQFGESSKYMRTKRKGERIF